jgi:YVTN family beta-propeller protein
VVISPDGRIAYVTGYNANTVTVINTTESKVVNTINVSAGPFHQAISPDGRWLYVLHYNSGSGSLVSVIDTFMQTVVSTIVVGTGPDGVSFTQDASFAYVSNYTSNNISVINTRSQTVVGTIIGGGAPIGVGVMGTVKVSTVVGGYVGDGGPATSAAFGAPCCSVLDASGNLFIADSFANRIRKVSPTGTITTYAGTGMCGYNGENIPSTKAMFCDIQGLTLDSSENLIVAEGGNFRIRKISASGKVTTIAGNGIFSYVGDGVPAVNTSIGQPYSPAYDSNGNLYFAQVGACRIRKVDTHGIITTIAGNGTCGYNGDGMVATAAELYLPYGVTVDSAGNIYIADTYSHRVRKVDTSGTITTFAGTGQPGVSGDGGLAINATVGNPRQLLIHNNVLYIGQDNALYVGQTGSSKFRSINLTTNVINTYAGYSEGYDGDGHSLLATDFNGPLFMQFDAAGNPIFDDSFNGRVRKSTGGIVTTIAGGFIGDGLKATSAAFGLAEALAIDKSGNLYIADSSGNRIRKVTGGKISTIAGTGISGRSGDGGPATSAMLNLPQGIAVDSIGNVFIADTNNVAIRKLDTTGKISTFASDARFCDLLQMATDSANNVYVADDCASVIFKITSTGAVSVVAGVLNSIGYNGDGIQATTAQLYGPSSVTFDATGNMVIADHLNYRVRQVDSSGVISTIAGNGFCGYTGDGGPATAAYICPNSVAADKSGNIFAADNWSSRIRKIKDGIITTFAGLGYLPAFNGDGLWPLYTTFEDPIAVAVDSKGAVYELDDVNQRVRKIQ